MDLLTYLLNLSTKQRSSEVLGVNLCVIKQDFSKVVEGIS